MSRRAVVLGAAHPRARSHARALGRRAHRWYPARARVLVRPAVMSSDEKREKKEKSSSKKRHGGGGVFSGDVVTDERFASMHRDPRFMAMPRKESAVTIDERFAGVFNDPNFASGGAGGADKRGRKSEKKLSALERQRADMRAYYKMDDDSDEEDSDLEGRMEKSMDRMRGVGLESSSEEESESEEEEIDEEEEGVLPTMLVGEADKDIPTIDATKRLAIVNCEWGHIRAVDLFAVLRSFVPKGGSLERVTVYPSDFGLERMAIENKYGPMSAFKKDEKKKAKSSAEGKSKVEDEGEEADNEQMRQYERDRLRYFYGIAEFDTVKTAMGVYHECDGIEYERSSFKLDLRYVPDDQSFAEREVRDVATDIPPDYEAPDFQVKALQHSNVKLSWDDDDPTRKKTFRRKITEENLKDEDFAAYLATDSESEESESEEDEEAAKAAKKAYLAKLLGNNGEVDDDGDDGEGEKDDFFLDDDDGEDTAKASTKAYKAKRDKQKYGSKSNAGDMEVTFHAGLEEFGARIKKKQKEGKLGVKETVYEQQERLRKEKREAKRQAAKKNKNDDSEDDAEEFADGDKPATFDDPFFMDDGGDVDFDAEYDSDDDGKKKAKKKAKFDADDAPSKTSLKKAKKKAKHGEVDEKAQADLELLMMDEKQILGKSDIVARKTKPKEDDEQPSKKKSRKERLAEKRRLRGKAARRAESDDEDDGEAIKLDTADDRFAGLYESHHFSLDPTDPRYKDVQNKTLIISERDKRRKSKGESKTSKTISALESEAKEIGSSELQNMLSSLKRKSQKK